MKWTKLLQEVRKMRFGEAYGYLSACNAQAETHRQIGRKRERIARNASVLPWKA
jgi:hypothetical protein